MNPAQYFVVFRCYKQGQDYIVKLSETYRDRFIVLVEFSRNVNV